MYGQKSAGFSLIEAMIAIFILVILAAMAAPSFKDMLEQNNLKQVVEELSSNLQWMRTETIKQGFGLQAAFTYDATTWSYQIYIPITTAGTVCAIQHTNHGCANPTTATCVLKTVASSQYTGITIIDAIFATAPTSTAEFNFRRGEAIRSDNASSSIGRARFTSTSYKTKVVVYAQGLVEICNTAGSTGLLGYVNC